MTRFFVAAVVVATILLAGCSKGDGNENISLATVSTPVTSSTPAAITTPPRESAGPATPVSVGRWDASAVFDYGSVPAGMALTATCSKSVVTIQATDACLVDAMKAARASDKAIEFFKAQGYFLASFEEKGRIDYGQGGAIWFNMGRPTQQLFLNGTPDIIEATIPEDYKADATYASVLKNPLATITPPSPFPWLEYGKLTSATTEAGGGQRLVIEYPLRDCRACADLGYLPIAYVFDGQGKIGTPQTLAFKPK